MLRCSKPNWSVAFQQEKARSERYSSSYYYGRKTAQHELKVHSWANVSLSLERPFECRYSGMSSALITNA